MRRIKNWLASNFPSGLVDNDDIANPKVYRALISQSSTNAPVATVLQNTLGGVLVWTRTEAGRYLGTLSGAFSGNVNSTRSNFYNLIHGENVLVAFYKSNDDSVYLETTSPVSEVGIDYMFNDDYLEILVFD